MFPIVNRLCVALLYGRPGRVTVQNGGFRPGQFITKLNQREATENGTTFMFASRLDGAELVAARRLVCRSPETTANSILVRALNESLEPYRSPATTSTTPMAGRCAARRHHQRAKGGVK